MKTIQEKINITYGDSVHIMAICITNTCMRACARRASVHRPIQRQVNSIATAKHHDDNKARSRMKALTKRKTIVYMQRDGAVITIIIVNRCVIVEMLEH